MAATDPNQTFALVSQHEILSSIVEINLWLGAPMFFEHVFKLLFATTVVSIFSYLLFFVAIGQAGNGGEYWGFNGYENPHDAAERTFESGDHRLLKVDISTALGKRITAVPIAAFCNDVPFGRDLPSRPSIDELIHGADSVRLATEFAHRYNNIIAFLVSDQMQPPCYIQRGRYSSYVGARIEQDWLAYIVIVFYVSFFWAVFELSAGPRHFKRCLDIVRNRIREREEMNNGKEQIQEAFETEKLSRRVVRKFRRFVHWSDPDNTDT